MAERFERRPSGSGISERAWQSSFRAFRGMPALFVSAVVLSVALEFAIFYVPQFRNTVFPPKEMPSSWTAGLFLFFIDAVWSAILGAISATVAVAMHRLILLDQLTSGIFSFVPRYTRQFVVWAVALGLASDIVNHLDFIFQKSGVVDAISFLGSVALLIVTFHLAMIFPAVATEVPAENWKARIVKSWNQMRGHCWLLFRATFIAFLPMLILFGVVWWAFGGLQAARQGGDLRDTTLPILAVARGLVQIFSVAVLAAVASWVYVWVQRQPSSPCSVASL
jgi:hypothetical protein